MVNRGVLLQSSAPEFLFTEFDTRDVVAWLLPSFVESAGVEATANLLGLPWGFVLSETSDQALIDSLETPEPVDGPLVRRRGIIHVVDTNPSDVTLPPRSLPVFLLKGRISERSTGLAARTRRFNMLEELNRRSPKHLVILAGHNLALPEELEELWADGFRSLITIVTDAPDVESEIEGWRERIGAQVVGLVPAHAYSFSGEFVRRYTEARGDRLILRLRDVKGNVHRLDITGVDDPEHPLLGRYELLTENHLLPLLPEDLKAEEVEGFFTDPSASWRPSAAGMPWPREPTAVESVKRALRRLDREGAEENQVFYVSAESGAGATTFIRDLAWTVATEGYPTLLSTSAPFVASGLEVASYMSRCLDAATAAGIGSDLRLYEAPWLIVFDRPHWESREDELISFTRQLEKSGRRACVIFVTGPYLPLTLRSNRRFQELPTLTHQVSFSDALELGQHLNRYLRYHGATRTEADWRAFFEQSTISDERGIAAFWIVLSFWLQRQFDMHETIQNWLYRQFREKVTDPTVKEAIISIAAMSTEHQLMPQTMLPVSDDWPTASKLEDLQKELGALGMVQFTDDTRRYWALIHDLLGRFLLTGLFYDHAAREAFGLSDAQNPEHMRFLVLKRIASMPALGLNELREVADSFATSTFKIDPDHGHALFSPFWREVLTALDEMPRTLRSTSRTFLHHSAISRRRISRDSDAFRISDDERAELLERATKDIEAAIHIAPKDSDDSDLSLLNSLALAYHDYAEVEERRGASQERIEELLKNANRATYSAYQLAPDNSFVIETFARDLLGNARSDPDIAAGNAIEVLGIVYSSMQRDAAEARRPALGRLADAAFKILFEMANHLYDAGEPQTESEAIVKALKALCEGVVRFEGMVLSDYPKDNRLRAAERLANPLLRNNAQAVRLRYLLSCLDRPYDFAQQLEFLETLEGSMGGLTPQARLEMAILLHQCDRHHEAERIFRNLRQLWRNQEHYVEVPERLRWLRVRDTADRRQVHARVSMTNDGRYLANVSHLQNRPVPFRPWEFGQERLNPGMRLNGLISFGHNGPFLRPLTAR